QAVDVLVVLVEHHAVEADLVGIGELIDILLVEAAAALAVPEPVRHRYPAGVVGLVEIRRQVGIGHEVPAIELDRLVPASLSDWCLVWDCCRAVFGAQALRLVLASGFADFGSTFRGNDARPADDACLICKNANRAQPPSHAATATIVFTL